MRIAGLDEVGVGPLAGPVVAVAAVYDDLICPFPDLFARVVRVKNHRYRDSKQLSRAARERLFEPLIDAAVDVGIGWATPEEIDKLEIHVAHKQALRRAVQDLEVDPDIVIVDGEKYKLRSLGLPQLALNKADLQWWQVSAASIIAKVWRDRLMLEYAKQYPGYRFDTNVGYPTVHHIQGLKDHGATPIHRMRYTEQFLDKKGTYKTSRASF
jgi:ribonuclease HII